MKLKRALVIDISPLRTSRDFRLLWSGHAVSFFGSELAWVAVPFQVYQLTHSTLAVGLISLFALVPLLTMSLLGGAFADAFDRRKVAFFSELSLAAVAAVLVANALLPHPQLWLLYAVTVVDAGLSGLGRPSRDAMVPRLVSKEQLPAAAALMSMYFNVASIAAPALAGVLIALVGLPLTYGIDVLSFGASLAAFQSMKNHPPAEDADSMSLKGVLDGLRFLRGRKVLQGTYLIDYAAMIFGMPEALFPAMANSRFGGPQALGLLYAAPAAGALLVSATSGWAGSIRRHGLAITFGVVAWGLAIIGFGVAQPLWLAVLFLAAAGGGDMVSGIFRNAIWNTTIPDQFRGRLGGVAMANYTSGPLLGNFESGAVAAWRGIQFSVISGGVLCLVAAAAVVAIMPQLLRYDSRDPTP